MEVGRVEGKLIVDSTDFDKGIDQAGQTLEGFGSRFSGLTDSMSIALGTFGGQIMTTIGGSLVSGLSSATTAVFDFSSQSQQAAKDLAATLGLPIEETEKLGAVANKVFANNFGTDVNDAATAIGEVRKQLGALNEDELQSVTENAFRMRDAFGLEVPDSINTVKTLMEQFGLTSDEAFDFIATGFQQGLDSSGDFKDTINEYANQFAASGLEADEFFSVLQSGLQGGVLGTDKIADAFKESRIRITEWSDEVLIGMRDVANESFGKELANQLGVADTAFINVQDNAQGVADYFKNTFGVEIDPASLTQPFDVLNEATGETETRFMTFADVYDQHVLGAFEKGTLSVGDLQKQMITGLGKMDDQIKQNGAGVKIFGTQWEDATAQGILNVDLTRTSLEDLAGATDKIDKKYESLGQVWEGVKRQAIVALSPIADQIINLANDFMPILSTAFEELGVFIQAAVSGGVWLFEQIKPIIQEVVGFIKELFSFDIQSSLFGMSTDLPIFEMLTSLQGLWESVWSAIQDIVNRVLPEVQALITSIFGSIQTFIQENWGTIQNIIMQAWEVIKGIIDAGVLFIQNVVTPIFTWLVTFITDHMEQIKSVLQNAWDLISTIVQGAMDIIKGIINTVMALLRGDWEGVWNGIKETFNAIWESIKSILGAALDYIKSVLVAAWDIIKDAIGSAWRGIRDNILIPVWDSIKGVFTSAIEGIKSGLSTAWDSIKTTVESVWNGIKNIVQGVWDSITDGISSAIDTVKNVIDSAKSLLEGAFSGAFGGVSNIVTGIMRGVVNSVVDIINGIIGATNSLIDGLNLVNPLEDIGHIPYIPHYAMGTDFHSGGLAWVGEQGPELISLPRGASVTPNHELQGIQGNSYILNVYTDRELQSITDEYDLMKALKG